MNYKIALLISIICLSLPLVAEEDPTPIHSSTTIPASSRYEIVQSTLSVKWTFRLDKQTGAVYQIVRDKDDANPWERMEIHGLPPAAATGVHYQIFLSGIVARFMFLMNLDTGKTWQLQHTTDTATKEETYAWEPI
jgi:hypothetical protein